MRPGTLALAVCVLALAACASGGGSLAGDDQPPDGDDPSEEVTVFAAAAFADAFEVLAERFAETRGDVEVALHFAGSQRLAAQILEGAPADVLASADASQMDRVAAAGLLDGEPETLARNSMAIATEPGNPLGIEGLEDLADPGVVLVLPAEEVPAGAYAREALRAAGVEVSPASLESDVRGALSKVELGEADAAIVYASDIAAGGQRVEGVEVAPEHDVDAVHPIAVTAEASDPDAARAFVAFALGEQGQGILAEHGFVAP